MLAVERRLRIARVIQDETSVRVSESLVRKFRKKQIEVIVV